MYLLPLDVLYLLPLEVETSPFRFLRYLLLPLVAIAVIATGVYLMRHRQGRSRPGDDRQGGNRQGRKDS